MSLICCPECNAQVSANTEQCPQCGYKPAENWIQKTLAVGAILLFCYGIINWLILL
jgi:hypothetical protein